MNSKEIKRVEILFSHLHIKETYKTATPFWEWLDKDLKTEWENEYISLDNSITESVPDDQFNKIVQNLEQIVLTVHRSESNYLAETGRSVSSDIWLYVKQPCMESLSNYDDDDDDDDLEPTGVRRRIPR